MPRKQTLQQIADDCIREARQPFSGKDFISQVQERWKRRISPSTMAALEKKLSDHQFLIGLETRNFLPFRAVLDKMGTIPLALPLSRFELQRRVFIPGYRLTPFQSLEIGTDQLTFLDASDGEIRKFKKNFLLEEVFEFFQYANEHKFPDHIKINEWVPDKSSLNLTVWDLEPYIHKNRMGSGDGILVELIDYDQGVFRLLPYFKNQERLDRLKMRILFVSLEEAIIRLNNNDFDFSALDLEKQLLRSFYELARSQLKVPAFSLDHFLDFTTKLTVAGYEWGNPRLVPSEKYKRLDFSFELAPKKPSGKCSSLNEILEDVGLPFNFIEFRAILRNTITRGTLKMEKLVDILFGGKGELFASAKQEDMFYRLLRKQMETLYLEVENPEPKAISELREKTVSVKLSLIKILKYLESFEVEITDLPLELLDQIMDLDSFCGEALGFLEDSQGPTNLKRIREIQLAHRIIGPKLAELEYEIYNELGIY